MNALSEPLQTIINVSNELQRRGKTVGSTSEIIAAAFVLNRQDLLPPDYRDMVEAWDRLGVDWQRYVRIIKRHYWHLILEAR